MSRRRMMLAGWAIALAASAPARGQFHAGHGGWGGHHHHRFAPPWLFFGAPFYYGGPTIVGGGVPLFAPSPLMPYLAPPPPPVLDQLKRALESAQQEEFEKDWDECVDAVKQAGLRKK